MTMLKHGWQENLKKKQKQMGSLDSVEQTTRLANPNDERARRRKRRRRKKKECFSQPQHRALTEIYPPSPRIAIVSPTTNNDDNDQYKKLVRISFQKLQKKQKQEKQTMKQWRMKNRSIVASLPSVIVLMKIFENDPMTVKAQEMEKAPAIKNRRVTENELHRALCS